VFQILSAGKTAHRPRDGGWAAAAIVNREVIAVTAVKRESESTCGLLDKFSIPEEYQDV
jgi:hypothetical protein